MPIKHYGKGDLIIEQGTRGDRSYVVRSGKVLVCRKEGPGTLVPIQELGPGEVFGEMYLLSKDATRNASVIAMNEVTVDILFEETIKPDLQFMSPLQKILFKGLNNRLNQTTDKFVKEKTQHAAAPGGGNEPDPAQRPNTSRDEIMGLVHDLKTPVAAEFQVLELLKKGYFGNPTPEQAEVLDAMVESNRYMASLIENMLKSYLYQSGRVALRREEINLNELIRAEVANLIMYTAQSKNVRIDLELDELLPPVWVDPLEIHRVINNLIQNALTHTPENGRIAVTTDWWEDQVAITVQDDGVGIKPQVLNFLFDENKPPEVMVSGTGLGLYLSKQIVDKHGGTITVESTPNQGSRFQVVLPIEKPGGLAT